MITRILNGQTKNITLASFILGGAYFGSAVLGLLRDRLLASYFGAGDELDVYYTAFRIPDLVAMLLIMGAVSAVIIPVFSQYLTRSKEEAWKFLSALLNLFLVSLILISAILVIFTPFLISLIAPGFSGEKKEIAVILTRIMFFSPILLGVSNIISGVLQVFHRFFVTALAPLVYNFGIICGILFFVPAIGIQGLAWGVVFGGFLHLLIQMPALFTSGFRYSKISFLKHPAVPKVIKLMAPRSLGLAASQVNLIIITAIASTMTSGSIAIFNLANNLAYPLIGMTAIPFSTAVFPSLSLAFSRRAKEEFIQKFSLAFRQILFLIIPLSFLFFVLRAQIVRIILGTGQFGWLDTRLTAACLGIFSLGLFAQGLILLVSKTFYAAHDTKIPALISVITVAVTLVLSFIFVWALSTSNFFQLFFIKLFKLEGIENITVSGLTLAFSLAAVFQFFLLLSFLYRKIGDFGVKEIFSSFIKIILASFLMGIIVYNLLYLLANFINMERFWGVFLQTSVAGLSGLLVYFILAIFFRFPELKTTIGSFKKEIKNGPKIN